MHDPRERRPAGHAEPRALRREAASIPRRRKDAGPEIATPVYPEKPEDYVPEDARRREAGRLVAQARYGRSLPAAPTSPVWSGAERCLAGCSNPRTAATPGRSTVRCGTTRAARNGSAAAPTAGHSFDLRRPARSAPRRSIGVSCGGVWRTRDGGATWTLGGTRYARGVHAAGTAVRPERPGSAPLAQCRGQPDVLWVQHHNGIFRSTDAGSRGPRSPA